MKYDGTESYFAYVRDIARFLASGPLQIGDEFRDLRKGAAALARLVMRLASPLMLPLCFVFAILARRFDKKAAEARRAWAAKWRYDLHRNGSTLTEK